MHFTDQRFGKALMDHEVHATKPVVTRTKSVHDLVVGFKRHVGLWLHGSKQRFGQWLIARGEKLTQSEPKLA